MSNVVYLFNMAQPRDKGGKWTTLPGFSGGAGDDMLMKKKLASLASQKSNAKKVGDTDKLAKIEQTMQKVKEAHAAAKAKQTASVEVLGQKLEPGSQFVDNAGFTYTIMDVTADGKYKVHEKTPTESFGSELTAPVDQNFFTHGNMKPAGIMNEDGSVKVPAPGAPPKPASASASVAGMTKGDKYKVTDQDGMEYEYEITGFKPNGDVLMKSDTGGQAGKEYSVPKHLIENDAANPTFTKVSPSTPAASGHNPGDKYQSPTGSTYEVVGYGSAPGYFKVKATTPGGKEIITDLPESALNKAVKVTTPAATKPPAAAASHYVGDTYKIGGDDYQVMQVNADGTSVKLQHMKTGIGYDYATSKLADKTLVVSGKPAPKPPYEGVDVGHKVMFQGTLHTVKGFTDSGEFVLDDPNGTYFGDFNASPGGVFVPHLPKGKQPLDQIDNTSNATVPAAPPVAAAKPQFPGQPFNTADKVKHSLKTTTELSNELKAQGVPYAGSMPKDMKAELLAAGINSDHGKMLIEKNKSEYLAKYSGGTKPASPVPGPKAPAASPGLAQHTQPTKEAQAQAIGAGNHQIPAGALSPVYPATHGQAKSFTYDKEFHGTHERYLFKDEHGDTWMIKPQTSKALADTEVAAHKLGWLAGHDLSDIRTMEVNLPNGEKKVGAMQKFHDADGTFQDKGITAAKLTPKHQAQVMQAQVLDWFLSNHDTHSENLLVGKDGNIKQIDKGQAWRYFGKDKLNESYNPNPVTPFYNSMWKDYIGGKVNLSFDDALPAIKSIKAIPDDVVTKHVLPTFQARDKIPYNGKGGWGETGFKNSQEAMQALLHRKNNIDKEFETFFKSVATKRAMQTGSAYTWKGWGDSQDTPF